MRVFYLTIRRALYSVVYSVNKGMNYYSEEIEKEVETSWLAQWNIYLHLVQNQSTIVEIAESMRDTYNSSFSSFFIATREIIKNMKSITISIKLRITAKEHLWLYSTIL